MEHEAPYRIAKKIQGRNGYLCCLLKAESIFIDFALQMVYMARVNLFFELIRDIEIEKIIKNHYIIRLKCAVQFKSQSGWSKPYPAIVDTGAHTSLLPFSIWKNLIHENFGKHKMFGISKNSECGISVEVGKINCIIIGFKGILEKFNVVSNFNQNMAYLEE
ncbi:MAG: hypothetical protein HY513_01295 [Candidatus Aenigmarchaeota archaeon]|nr:hypothetical protein [Candidatus Aenigmarchaeota archaeon]